MKSNLLNSCEQLVQQRDILKRVFRFGHEDLYSISAFLLLKSDHVITEDELTAARELLKKRTGIFSHFRSIMVMPASCYLALHQNDPAYLDQVLELYSRLKKNFRSSDYTAMLSLILPDLEDVENLMERGQRLYKLMNHEHPFLTSSEDRPAAVLMAASEKTDDQLISDMESAYRRMKDSLSFADSNGLQSLAQLVAGGDSLRAVDRVLQIRDGLEAAGRKYAKGFELTALGALGLSDLDVQEIVTDILDADSYLQGVKGYGVLGFSAKRRLMHAAMLVSASHKNADSDAYMLSSTISEIITQNAMVCCVVASCAVSSSSSSSSNS